MRRSSFSRWALISASSLRRAAIFLILSLFSLVDALSIVVFSELVGEVIAAERGDINQATIPSSTMLSYAKEGRGKLLPPGSFNSVAYLMAVPARSGMLEMEAAIQVKS